MSELFVPSGYAPRLDVYRTQKAIAFIKRTFQDRLAAALNLKRVSAPLFVTESSGLNDNLNGYERPVSFDIPAVGESAEVVHSLAKWKRLALKEYHFYVGNGLYTDMNAIRRDEERTIEYLISTVEKIVGVICDTNELLKIDFPELNVNISRKVKAITTAELLEMYPNMTAKERENAVAKEFGTVLLMQIGGKLKDGKPHDGRAPDYDDWELNGDILFYNEVLGRAFEISSMGIRVDEKSLDRQLKISGCDDRRTLPFHSMLLAGELPLTIGGGIGQSRLCMLMMGSAHIGEVQSSIWDKETLENCKKAGIRLL